MPISEQFHIFMESEAAGTAAEAKLRGLTVNGRNVIGVDREGPTSIYAASRSGTCARSRRRYCKFSGSNRRSIMEGAPLDAGMESAGVESATTAQARIVAAKGGLGASPSPPFFLPSIERAMLC